MNKDLEQFYDFNNEVDPYDLISLQVDLNSDIDYILFETGLIVANLKGLSEEEILNSWWFKYYEENNDYVEEADIVEDE